MEDRRNVGENICNSGDGKDQTCPIFDVYDDFWYAIIGNDHISKLIMLTIIILATIVYFLGILLLKAVTSSK